MYDTSTLETVNLADVSAVYGYHTFGSGSGTLTCKRCGTTAQSLTSASVKLSYTSCTYNGTSRKPSVTVTLGGTKLTKGTDYVVKYSNNKSAGTATVKITGIGQYGGIIKKNFTIKAKSISSGTATLSTVKYTYNSSKTRKPSVTLKVKVNGSTKKLTKGTDYTVSYSSGRKAVGKYTVKIKGTGNYTGTITKTFKIVPKKVTISSAKSSSAKKITLKWKKAGNSTVYYKIRYRVKGTSTWKTKTVKSSKSTMSKTLTGLKSGKKYQIQILAYKKVDGKTYKGSWSKTKTVTVK